MLNKKVIIDSLKNLGSAKAPPKKADIIIDPRGQWDHPGEITQIPGSQITMQPDPLTGKKLTRPLLGVGSNGQKQMMYPGQNYDFGNAEYVTEYPQMRKGGTNPKLPKNKNSRGYSRSLEATNKFFAEHSFFAKPKSRKNKIYDPKAKYYQEGGAPIPKAYQAALSQYVNPFVNETDENTGYNGATGEVNRDTRPGSIQNNDWWMEHEKFHHLQNLAGGLNTAGVVGKRPNNTVASDESIQGYYNRRDSDLNDHINSMIKANPELQFIPRDKLLQSQFPVEGEQPSFLGAEDSIYQDPSTVEGEARMYEQYINEGNPSIFPKKQEGGVSSLEGDLISKVLMNRNRGIDFVDRAYALGDNPGTPMFNVPDDEQFGQYMSHKMAWGTDDNGQAWMYPTVMNPNDEAIQVPNQYADYISSEGYKNATGMNQYQDSGENGPWNPNEEPISTYEFKSLTPEQKAARDEKNFKEEQKSWNPEQWASYRKAEKLEANKKAYKKALVNEPEYYNEAMQFVKDWHDSPMYNQMVLNSYNGNQKNADYLTKLRKKNIATIPPLQIKEKGDMMHGFDPAGQSTNDTGQIEVFSGGYEYGPALYTHEILHSSDRPRELYKWNHPGYKIHKSWYDIGGKEYDKIMGKNESWTKDENDNSFDIPDWMTYDDPRFPKDDTEWFNRVMPVSDQMYITKHRGSNYKDNQDYKNKVKEGYFQAKDLASNLEEDMKLYPDFYKKMSEEFPDYLNKSHKETLNKQLLNDKLEAIKIRKKEYPGTWKELGHDYVSDPTEVRARLGEIRQHAKKEGIYDPFTEQITPELFKNYINKERDNDNWQPIKPIEELRQDFTDEEILWMLQNISKNNKEEELDVAAEGGSFINTELSPEEIEQYKKGGYIIEDISVPELNKAQLGFVTKNIVKAASKVPGLLSLKPLANKIKFGSIPIDKNLQIPKQIYTKDIVPFYNKDIDKYDIYEVDIPKYAIPGRSFDDVQHKLKNLRKDLKIGPIEHVLSKTFGAKPFSLDQGRGLLGEPSTGRLWDSNTRYWLNRMYGNTPSSPFNANNIISNNSGGFKKVMDDIDFNDLETQLKIEKGNLNRRVNSFEPTSLLINPWEKKSTVKLQKGGSIDYELGDEIDEATMKQLMKLGYTFEKI